MKVHQNCKGEECGSNDMCSKNTSMRYGCSNHDASIEVCATCRYIEKVVEDNLEDVSYVCLLQLEETTRDDYCPCWEYKRKVVKK